MTFCAKLLCTCLCPEAVFCFKCLQFTNCLISCFCCESEAQKEERKEKLKKEQENAKKEKEKKKKKKEKEKEKKKKKKKKTPSKGGRPYIVSPLEELNSLLSPSYFEEHSSLLPSISTSPSKFGLFTAYNDMNNNYDDEQRGEDDHQHNLLFAIISSLSSSSSPSSSVEENERKVEEMRLNVNHNFSPYQLNVEIEKWSQKAQRENKLITFYSHLTQQLIAISCPPDLVMESIDRAKEQIVQSNTCFQLASFYSNQHLLPPQYHSYSLIITSDLISIIERIIKEGIVNETIRAINSSFELANEQSSDFLKDVLKRNIETKLKNSALCWRILKWALSSSSSSSLSHSLFQLLEKYLPNEVNEIKIVEKGSEELEGEEEGEVEEGLYLCSPSHRSLLIQLLLHMKNQLKISSEKTYLSLPLSLPSFDHLNHKHEREFALLFSQIVFPSLQ